MGQDKEPLQTWLDAGVRIIEALDWEEIHTAPAGGFQLMLQDKIGHPAPCIKEQRALRHLVHY
jgi:hypothetical protein